MQNKYLWGVFWSISACLISALNDLISKLSGSHLGGIQVLFFRFFFSTLFLLPLVIKNPQKFETRHLKIHGLRGGLFALAMLPWCYGLIQLPLPLVTTISFTTPLFVTIMAQIILKESVGWRRLMATLIGFAGIVVSTGFTYKGINGVVGLALLATFLFAVLDIVNKRLLTLHEGIESMMFFSALWTTVLMLPLVIYHWQIPAWADLGLLALLGLGANGLLGCLLKASACCDLSALQPLRYTEFIFSSLLSVLVFGQWPTMDVLLGIALIVPATLYLGHHELKLEKRPPVLA